MADLERIRAQFKLERGAFCLDVALDVPARGITAIFGPSGSGKTTLLRCLAGLEQVAGAIYIAGQCWQSSSLFLPPSQRGVGLVFQAPTLFPHLSVQKNLEYGWKRTPPAERRLEFSQVIQWLGLAELLKRWPRQLSGGQQQRVAIGRALLSSPRLLLMDEPLAALDEAARQEILPYLERLHRELELPVFYVSHALEEVAALADYLLYLEAGSLRLAGPIGECLTRLDSPLVTQERTGAFIESIVVAHDERFALTELSFSGGILRIPREDLPLGQSLRVHVLARDVSLALEAPRQSSILNSFPAIIEEQRELSASQSLVRLDLKGSQLLAKITRKSSETLNLTPGMHVYAQVKSVALLKRG